MKWTSRCVALVVLAAFSSACGGDDEKAKNEPTLDILDPAEPHYGKTYQEWAADWVQYLNDVAPPQCINPILDTTGASCALYQDSTSPVFMLVGNYGGVSIREECVVPAAKAIYLPLTNIYGDNAGVPADLTVSDAEIKAYVEENFELVDPASLRLDVDGHAIEQLERGAFPSAPYVIELEPGANIYECNAVPGVEGEFPGYVGGYWAMLGPLGPGAHTIEFGGRAGETPQGQPLIIDVRYELTVEEN